jgi:hypothetical protein
MREEIDYSEPTEIHPFMLSSRTSDTMLESTWAIMQRTNTVSYNFHYFYRQQQQQRKQCGMMTKVWKGQGSRL